jgi:hypothetical protein
VRRSSSRSSNSKNNTLQTLWVIPTRVASLLLMEFENVLSAKRLGELSDIDPCVARWAEWCWRLSINLHATKWMELAPRLVLEDVTMAAAIGLADYFSREQ